MEHPVLGDMLAAVAAGGAIKFELALATKAEIATQPRGVFTVADLRTRRTDVIDALPRASQRSGEEKSGLGVGSLLISSSFVFLIIRSMPAAYFALGT